MNTNKTQAEQLPQDAVMQSVLKASDLRIGNKILFLGDVVTFKNITEFREDGIFWIKTFEPKIESKNFHFKPIPLTEEWLLKFGFSNIQYNKEIDCNIYSGWDFGSICIQYPRGIEAHIFLGNYPVAIKYVHELQNLYFALKGRELTVA